MKNVKTITCLISLLVAGITNVWGAEWTCGNVKVNLTGTTLTLSPVAETDGVMDDLTQAETFWRTSGNRGNVQTIIIEDGVSYIGEYAFYYCTAITSITIPTSVTGFGEKAFYSTNSAKKIYYAGTPNEWAQIDFTITESNSKYYPYSHPFYGSTSSNKFYFYGSASAMNAITLEPGITEVKPYAFYNATGVTGINIPGSISTIGKCAFAVSSYASGAWIAINKQTAPSSVATDAFKTGVTMYVPSGKSGYAGAPWSSFTITDQDVNGDCGTPTAANVTWQLSEDGVLTLTGHGDINIGTSGAGLSFARFRRLVKKLVVNNDGTGDISSLGHAIHWCYGISEVTINQPTIPTSENIATESATNFAYLFNPSKNVVMNIKAASLTDGTVSNLGSAPWNSAKLEIALSDDVTIDQASADNTTILTNCSTYVEKPVNVQLTRSTFSPLYYNTFCSPVRMTNSEIKTLFGDTTHLVEFDDAVVENDTLRLNFKDATAIVAGQPYLIKPENSVSNPRFTGITPTALATSGATVEGTDASFYGILSPLGITDEWAEGKNFIFLLAENKFTYATGGTLKGMRAYFLLGDDVEPSVLAHSPKMRINYEAEGGQTPTAIDKTQTEVKAEKVMENGVMYIIKNGVKYSVMGERVK